MVFNHYGGVWRHQTLQRLKHLSKIFYVGKHIGESNKVRFTVVLNDALCDRRRKEFVVGGMALFLRIQASGCWFKADSHSTFDTEKIKQTAIVAPNI